MKQQESGATVLLWHDKGESAGQVGPFVRGVLYDGVAGLNAPKGIWESRLPAKLKRDGIEGILVVVKLSGSRSLVFPSREGISLFRLRWSYCCCCLK